MATQPAIDALNPVVAAEIVLLDPNEIEIGDDRLRVIDTLWATGIGASMAREGQINAVHVCSRAEGGYRLAGPGAHRVTGARIAGIPIEAKIVSANVAGQRRREAAENVFRRPNDPLERAAAVAELVRLHREKVGLQEANRRHASVPTSRAAALRDEAKATLDTMSNVYGFSAEIGEALGFSDRTIRRDLFLYRNLAPAAVGYLRGARHAVLDNAAQLRALAKLDPDRQAAVVQLLVAPEDRARTVSEAVGRLGYSNSVRMDAEAKRLSTFIGTFKRMGLAEKKGALAHFAPLLPAGFKLIDEGTEA
ncbi:hypothetical protein P1X14_18945 [Sphingomonas sp. AOB5]|uniref:hypothetical protein n=1 Tax=Sphingomonas sp. AOB5 TaxID=3034017 RepID=UPI0023F7EF9F|nr:hypothetical protein [Sphingomonas sp. AOB5]MDF7777343.1 hypothetical protein [Sphingomonas sp. AOB5]